ncbi:MAG: hypothetical protein ACTSX6_06085 [Candidatus Heimdallarchaeaceae archaeon]
MSGYSPTWTNKGSDKLRALQTTKILVNSLKRVISSFDISNKETEEVIVSAIADVVFNYFTPNRDLTIEEQFDLLAEFLGWKNLHIKKSDESANVQFGANRFISSDTNDLSYLLITIGLTKALGFFLFNSDVRVERKPSQFQSQQLELIIQKVDAPIPTTSEKVIISEPSVKTIITQTKEQDKSTTLKPQLSAEEGEIKPSIELSIQDTFSPILKDYPVTIILPIFHRVLAETIASYFSDMEDANVKKAKEELNEKNILYLIEFLLINIIYSEQNMREIASLIGQYTVKAIQAKSNEELKKFLPNDVISDISRRVAYVEFPARAFCTYAPGERCVEGKRDLCDFILYMWEGMLTILLPEKKFHVGERIPATRRGNFCLLEFLKG